ncbi:hypothetical protein [Geoglobus acetivorans]|uniref:Uncharacterized protein n=1 Tax=Geoglobus acetivorans TaxID=565033 RepID=A0A0A7GBE9_GEOAI|nr:hypothetical protein GACE_0314 [Geoglobus acetivorans]
MGGCDRGLIILYISVRDEEVRDTDEIGEDVFIELNLSNGACGYGFLGYGYVTN